MEDPRIISLLTELVSEFKKISGFMERMLASNPKVAVPIVKIHKKSVRKMMKLTAPAGPAGEGWIAEHKVLKILGVDRTTLWRHRVNGQIKKWTKKFGEVHYWHEEITGIRPRYIK